jgi:hypothetical protein
MFHIVYKTIHTESEKFYIGVHSTLNINDGYLGSGKHIKAAVKKYGKDAFKREILHECDSKEEAFTIERSIVTREFLLVENTYNLAEGGAGHELDTDSRSKTVLVYDQDFKLIETFPSYVTAARFLDSYPSTVINACVNSTNGKASRVRAHYVSYEGHQPIKKDMAFLQDRNKELWKINVGKKRPEHGKLVTELNRSRPEAQVLYKFVHKSGIEFFGTRTELRESFPQHNILASELANLSSGRAKSTRGWSLVTP